MTMSMTNRKADGPGGASSSSLPPKPYTEYTIFFRLERTHILQSTGIIDEEILSSLDPNHVDNLEFPRPDKYRNLALPPYWYSSSHKAAIEKKRKHRKREGRMDLKTLSKTISASWRNADPEIVEYCRKLARAELDRYNEVVEGIMMGTDHLGNKSATATASPIQVQGSNNFGNGQMQQMKMHLLQQQQQQQQRQQMASNSNGGPRWQRIPDGALSLNDFVVQPAKQGPMTTSPVLSKDTNNCPSMGGPNEDFIKMIQLQQLQLAHENSISQHNHRSRQLTMNGGQLGQAVPPAVSSTSTNTISPNVPMNNNSNNNKNTQKRKFVRRASAPPEFNVAMLGNLSRPGQGNSNGGDVNNGGNNSMNTNFARSVSTEMNNNSMNSHMMCSSSNNTPIMGNKPGFNGNAMPSPMASRNFNNNSSNVVPSSAPSHVFHGGFEDASSAPPPSTKPFRRRSMDSATNPIPSAELQALKDTFRKASVPSVGSQGSFNIGSMGNSSDANSSKPRTFKMRRRSSMTNMNQGLRSSFKMELQDAAGFGPMFGGDPMNGSNHSITSSDHSAGHNVELFGSSNGNGNGNGNNGLSLFDMAMAEHNARNAAADSSKPRTFKPQDRGPRRRRVTVSVEPGHERGGALSSSFQEELNNTQQRRESFTCIPEWEKEDADALLDILDFSEKEAAPNAGASMTVAPVIHANAATSMPPAPVEDFANSFEDVNVARSTVSRSPEVAHHEACADDDMLQIMMATMDGQISQNLDAAVQNIDVAATCGQCG